MEKERKSVPSAPSAVSKVQEELLDCVRVVKGEIVDTLLLLESYIEDNGATISKEQLEILLRKMRVVALTSRSVHDYILEIDSPKRKL